MKVLKQIINCTSSISSSFFLLILLRQLSLLKSVKPWIFGTIVWAILVRLPLETSLNLSKVSVSHLAIRYPNVNLVLLANMLILLILLPSFPKQHSFSNWYTDLCGPFPVLTPHGKQYLIAFLEDSANILSSS